MGVKVTKTTNIYADNQSVFLNSTVPGSTLNKKAPSGVNWRQWRDPRPQGESTQERETPQGLLPHPTDLKWYLPPTGVDWVSLQVGTSDETLKQTGYLKALK